MAPQPDCALRVVILLIQRQYTTRRAHNSMIELSASPAGTCRSSSGGGGPNSDRDPRHLTGTAQLGRSRASRADRQAKLLPDFARKEVSGTPRTSSSWVEE